MVGGKQFKLDILIKAIDGFTAPLDRINGRIVAMNRAGAAQLAPVRNSAASLMNSLSTISASAGVPQLVEAFKGVATAVAGVGAAAYKSGKRIAGMALAGAGLAYAFKREFIDPADEIQRLGLSLTSIERGDTDKAKTDIGFIKNVTLKSPFELNDMVDVFRTMRAQGLDPLNGEMQSLVDYIAKIGGSSDVLQRMALELGHASSMGKLQSQQARALAREGIPVWDLLSRAIERVTKGRTKLNEAQLIKIAGQGGLGKKAIGLLIEEMGIESQGMAEKMSTMTFSGMLTRLGNQWKFFAQRVMKLDDLGRPVAGGPMDVIQGKLRAIDAWLDRISKNGQLQQWADQLGGLFNRAFAFAERGFAWLQSNGPRIFAQMSDNLQTILNVADGIAEAFGGWGNLITFGIAAYIGGPLVASVFSLIAAIATLNLALAGTPAGLLLAGGALAIGGAILAFKALKTPGAQPPADRRVDNNGLPLFTGRTALAALGAPPDTGAQQTAAPIAPAAPGLRDVLRTLNPFGAPQRPEDTIAGKMNAAFGGTAGAAAPRLGPPANVQVAKPSLRLSDADQQALATAIAAANSDAPRGRVQVDIQHSNVPTGTKMRVQSSGDIDLSRGVAMAHAF